MECVIQSGSSGPAGLPLAQLQQVRELAGATGTSAETRLLAQAVLDLSALVAELMKANEGQAKKSTFRVGG
jgi:hypothetical protein